MKINPRLDLFKIQLKRSDESFTTFYDFARAHIEEDLKHLDTSRALLQHLTKKFDTDIAKSSVSQKMLCLVKDKKINIYSSKKPKFNSTTDIISGVINGGTFGRDGILYNIEDSYDAEKLDRNKGVLSYYYIFLYLPKDYNIGLAMIHSNSSEENITPLFKDFIRKCFKEKGYYFPNIDAYCPKSFQENFKNGASIQKISFTQEFIEPIHSNDPITKELVEYDIQIIATPKSKNVNFKNVKKFVKLLNKKIFKVNNTQQKSLDKFDKSEVTAKDNSTSTQRTFEWNDRDNDFVPVIYLQEKITKKNPDGSPDFDSLKEYCKKLFKDEILNELRPDNNVQRT